jgi:hypothetical protein
MVAAAGGTRPTEPPTVRVEAAFDARGQRFVQIYNIAGITID